MSDLWALFITAVVSLFTGAYLQGRGSRIAAWHGQHAAMQEARRKNYADLTQAVSDFVHINELRGLAPGFVPPATSNDGTEAGRQAEAASQSAGSALAQIMLVSPGDTFDAARTWMHSAYELIDHGLYEAPDDHPLRVARADARRHFMDHARRDLRVAPLDYDESRLSWPGKLMLRVPALRSRAERRALFP